MNLWLLVLRPLIIIWAFLVDIVKAFSPVYRGESRFFLDTANEKEWDELLCTGMFHGVTTNPTLLQQANQPCTAENLHRMANVALQSVEEIMVQTWGTTVEDLYETGMALSAPARDRIVIRVPITLIGVQAATKLIQAGCRVCLTACFDHKQALIAVSIGAEYIAPYLGCMNDARKDGVKECIEMMEMVDGMQGETRILVTDIRNVHDLSKLACNDMETFTISPKVARDLFVEPLTDNMATDFEKVARSIATPQTPTPPHSGGD